MSQPKIQNKTEYWTARCERCGRRRIGDLHADGSADITPCPLPVEVQTAGKITTTRTPCKGTAVRDFEVHK